MHIATKMASSYWSARKECSPQGNSQAQRQTHNISCKQKQYSQQEILQTAKSSTTALSTRPFAVAVTRFRRLSEPHPTHDVDTPSSWLSFFVCLRKAWTHLVGNCALLVWICALLVERCALLATSLVGKLLPLRGLEGALRGVGRRLSQFCGTMAHFASTNILSVEQQM